MSTDNIIAGQVVQADDDTAADESVPPAPETYFHKVAGPQRSTTYSPGYAAEETPVAADPAATDPDLPAVDAAADPDLPAAGSDVDNAPYVDDANQLDDANELDDVADPHDMDELDNPAPVASALPADGSVTAVSDAPKSLLGDTTTLMAQWRQAAVEFVDDPRASVSHAADVAAEAVSRLETVLCEQRAAWDGNGTGNGQTDTEALRQAILGYRRFLDRLVS
jgi:hypothetical protein